MTKQPHLYALSTNTPSMDGGAVVGIFTTLEKAKTEAERYNKRANIPLQWNECVTDRAPRTPSFWEAPLTTWAIPTTIRIERRLLDGKAFRP